MREEWRLPTGPPSADVSVKAAWVLCGCVLFGSLSVEAGGTLKMRVSPRMSYAPSDLFVYVTVERRSENRFLVVSAESADFFRSSIIQLDGEDSARVTVFNFRQLPPGNYDIEAYLIGANGRRIEVTRSDVTLL